MLRFALINGVLLNISHVWISSLNITINQVQIYSASSSRCWLGNRRLLSLMRAISSIKHWNRFKGNVGETSVRQDGAHMGFSELMDTILN